MDDLPEKPGAHAKGKIAVFAFKGDDVYEPVRAAVVKLLRSKGLNVTASLRPVDSAAQFREMSYTLNLGAFVEGEITGDGPHQTAVIHLRSGMSGKRIASTKLTGSHAPDRRHRRPQGVAGAGRRDDALLFQRRAPAPARARAAAHRGRQPRTTASRRS